MNQKKQRKMFLKMNWLNKKYDTEKISSENVEKYTIWNSDAKKDIVETPLSKSQY